MDSEVVEERVVAMEAVVASSKDGGVQGRSGRPEGTTQRRSWRGEKQRKAADVLLGVVDVKKNVFVDQTIT